MSESRGQYQADQEGKGAEPKFGDLESKQRKVEQKFGDSQSRISKCQSGKRRADGKGQGDGSYTCHDLVGNAKPA